MYICKCGRCYSQHVERCSIVKCQSEDIQPAVTCEDCQEPQHTDNMATCKNCGNTGVCCYCSDQYDGCCCQDCLNEYNANKREESQFDEQYLEKKERAS